MTTPKVALTLTLLAFAIIGWTSTAQAQRNGDESETARKVSRAEKSSRTLKVEGLPRRGQHL